jgi:hypothetical protein
MESRALLGGRCWARVDKLNQDRSIGEQRVIAPTLRRRTDVALLGEETFFISAASRAAAIQSL